MGGDDVLTNLFVLVIHNICIYQIIVFDTLNLHNAIYKLYLNKDEISRKQIEKDGKEYKLNQKKVGIALIISKIEFDLSCVEFNTQKKTVF